MTTITAAVDDLFDQQVPVDQALDRHFAQDFRQRTDGTWKDRLDVRSRMIGLRQAVQQATVTVLNEINAGSRYAELHIIDLTLRDGTRIRREVAVFADRDLQGLFVRIEEMTRFLDLEEEPEDKLGLIHTPPECADPVFATP